MGLVALVVALWWLSEPYREAISLLRRYEGLPAPRLLLLPRHPTSVTPRLVSSEHDAFSALVVEPEDLEDPPGIVLVPGIHEGGIHEPRLVRYARELAGTGFVVLVPELFPNGRRRLDERALERVKAGAAWLAHRTGRQGVAAVGVSFGGGLALREACDVESRVSVALSIGGHHDLARVLRWYAGERPTADDDEPSLPSPSPYGAKALLDSYAPDTPANATREALLHVARAEAPVLARLSPAGTLAACEAPLYAVHGARDDIIPATEAAAIAREQPRARVARTPYLSHVDPDADVSLEERVRLVRLLADFLVAARDIPLTTSPLGP